jgi:hypothetical protein
LVGDIAWRRLMNVSQGQTIHKNVFEPHFDNYFMMQDSVMHEHPLASTKSIGSESITYSSTTTTTTKSSKLTSSQNEFSQQLFNASYNGSSAICKKLIRKGADVNFRVR